MSQMQPILGPDFAKRSVRFVLAVVGLLILRAITGALPMLKNAPAIGDSLISPLVIVQAVVETIILAVILGFGLGVGRLLSQNYARFPDLGKMISLATVAPVLLVAYKVYQVPTACLTEARSDLAHVGSVNAPGALQQMLQSLGIRGALEAAAQMVQQNPRIGGDGGATLLTTYQQVAVLALRQPPDLYGWTFLLLIAFPIVGIVVLVARNLDSLTEIVFHSAAVSLKSAPAGGGPVAGDAVIGTGGGNGSPVAAVEKLAKLKTLVDAGAISDEDFTAQKSAILQRVRATESEGLRRLKALVDSGALTGEEYAVQKQYFLDHL